MSTAIDVRIISTPVRAPRANAIAERFLSSVRRELLDRILIINRWHEATVLRQLACTMSTIIGRTALWARPLPPGNHHARTDTLRRATTANPTPTPILTTTATKGKLG